jgi:N-methylhydantoinase A
MRAIGIDIGGTFTDFVVADIDTGRMQVIKVLSSPGNEWQAVLQGIKELALHMSEVQLVVHGTTVATNVLIEGSGARTALVTSVGFRDLLEIGRCMRLTPGSLFNTHFRRPAPLVPRTVRFECPERMRADGTPLRVPTEVELERLARAVAIAVPESVAVCLLHAYANPTHERMVRLALNNALPGVPVYLSSEVLPEYREFERLSTTIINAMVSPILARYLDELERSLRGRGFTGPFLVMGSNGGMMTQQGASILGAQTILSGPVGGVRGAARAARTVGRNRIVTLDMGGTSADVSIMDGAEPTLVSENLVGGFPLKLPQMRIRPVGAGGGSIAWCDEGGTLRVGPKSAGAIPGPACYGLGGQDFTVTDANLKLGRLEDGMLLGDHVRLHLEPTEMVGNALAAALRLSTERLAEGVIQISVARIGRAIKELCLEQGQDPRDFSLVAFGGAGPMHAAMVAEEIGLEEVIIPPFPGNVSAYGLLSSGLRRDTAQTLVRSWDNLDSDDLLTHFAELVRRLETQIRLEGWPGSDRMISCAVDLRYVGQASEVTVPLNELSLAGVAALPDAFHKRHHQLFGQSNPIGGIELITLRASVVAMTPPWYDLKQETAPRSSEVRTQERPVYFYGRWELTSIYPRRVLGVGQTLSGPAIVDESGATTIVPPGWKLQVHTSGAISMTQ